MCENNINNNIHINCVKFVTVTVVEINKNLMPYYLL